MIGNGLPSFNLMSLAFILEVNSDTISRLILYSDSNLVLFSDFLHLKLRNPSPNTLIPSLVSLFTETILVIILIFVLKENNIIINMWFSYIIFFI